MPIKVGADLGNAESMLAWGARQRSLKRLPSYLGSGAAAELTRLTAGGRSEAAGVAADLVLVYEGVELFVGDLAIRQSQDATSGRGDVGRYWSGHTKRLFLTMCGQAWPGQHMQLYVVTGLPVEVWSEENAAKVAHNLMGMSEYVLGGQKQKTTVLGVLVVMEGAGAGAQLGGDDPDLEEATLDIGGRTTLAYWTRAQEPILAKCGQLDAGVEKIGDNLSAWFEQTYGRPLRLFERRDLIRHALDPKAHPHPKIHVAGTLITITSQLRAEVQRVGDEIASFVKRIWRSSERGAVAAEAASVHLVGGGAYYFGDTIRAIIPNIIIPDMPEAQNAYGYLSIAQAIGDDEWADIIEACKAPEAR